MKAKIARRISAVIISLALCVSLLSTSVLAAGTVNDVKEKTDSDGSIVVTVYDQNPGSIGTGAETALSGKPVDGVGINALRIGSVVELTSTDGDGAVSTQVAFGLTQTYMDLLGLVDSNAIASENDTYYFAPTVVQDALKNADQNEIEAYLDNGDNGAENEVTDSYGVATFDTLTYGLYLLAKSELPADATTDLVPFLVSVPMYVESDSGNEWQSTVYAYPKVRTGEITITKTVDDKDGTAYADGDIYVNAGQTLQYTVTATIPGAASGEGSANKFTVFDITDTNTGETLDIDTDTLEVKLGDNTLTKETQYEFSYENGVLNISLTNTETTGGLAALNNDLSQAQTITVTYDAAVVKNATFSSKLSNSAIATYQHTGMASSTDTSAAAVDLYTYGIDLTKTLSDGAEITADTISFELYKTNSAGTLSDKVPVKLYSNGYWVEADGAESDVMYVGAADGKLNLYGLEPGTYYLKEASTMTGYTMLADFITIVISDNQKTDTEAMTATVNSADAQVVDGVVFLSVENTKNELGFNLPQTGGVGTLLATAVGLGLLCAAVILLVIYRKKRQKNN